MTVNTLKTRRRTRAALITGAAATALALATAHAAPPPHAAAHGKAKHKQKANAEARADTRLDAAVLGAAAALALTSDDRTILRNYYNANPQLIAASRKDLPPGIQKKLRRGGTLPPGLRARGVPAELSGRLTPIPRGYDRVVVDGRVLLIEAATRAIVEAFVL